MCAHSHTTRNRLRSRLAHQKQLGVGHLTSVQSCRHAQECGAILGWGMALHRLDLTRTPGEGELRRSMKGDEGKQGAKRLAVDVHCRSK